jgi:putative oxidoreductase
LQQYEWIGILLARLSVGTLFALSGSGKLFVPSRRLEMLKTLHDARIPAPGLNALLVSSVEFTFGTLLVAGFLTPLCCVMLTGVMVVALGTSILRESRQRRWPAGSARCFIFPKSCMW